MPEHAEVEVAGQPRVSAYRSAWATSSVHSVPNQRGPAPGLRPGPPRQACRSTRRDPRAAGRSPGPRRMTAILRRVRMRPCSSWTATIGSATASAAVFAPRVPETHGPSRPGAASTAPVDAFERIRLCTHRRPRQPACQEWFQDPCPSRATTMARSMRRAQHR